MPRILGLGDNTVDTYVDAGVQYPGGNAVNVAVMTHRLGASTAYLGCVGDDDGGQLILKALRTEGVDISRVRTRHGANARAYIGHVDGDRQFIRSGPGVRADYQWEEADFDYVGGFDHVHTSIYSDLGGTFPRIAASARSLSFDASNRWTKDNMRPFLPHARYVFLSAAELTEVDCVTVAESFLAQGPEAIVVTRGSEGALGFAAGEQYRQRALPTEVVDTLGAGDGFISGLLVALLSGQDLKSAMASGADFASRVCGWSGGFGHSAPWLGNAAERAIAAR
jgi:fructoselysine 6-kinase